MYAQGYMGKFLDRPARESQKDRTLKMVNDPDFYWDLLEFISEGGTLIEWCKKWDINYSMVAAWLYEDKSRGGAYREALQRRKHYWEENIVLELGRLMNADLRSAFNNDGTMKPVSEWDDGLAGAVQSVTTRELTDADGEVVGHTRDLKLRSKEKGIELLGKKLGLFKEKVEVNHTLTLEKMIARVPPRPISPELLEAKVDGPAQDQVIDIDTSDMNGLKLELADKTFKTSKNGKLDTKEVRLEKGDLGPKFKEKELKPVFIKKIGDRDFGE